MVKYALNSETKIHQLCSCCLDCRTGPGSTFTKQVSTTAIFLFVWDFFLPISRNKIDHTSIHHKLVATMCNRSVTSDTIEKHCTHANWASLYTTFFKLCTKVVGQRVAHQPVACVIQTWNTYNGNATVRMLVLTQTLYRQETHIFARVSTGRSGTSKTSYPAWFDPSVIRFLLLIFLVFRMRNSCYDRSDQPRNTLKRDNDSVILSPQ